jgi:hypothetical protein
MVDASRQRGLAALREGEGLVTSPRLRLLLASFLMLFVELALIRWSSSNNFHLAYATNFVLLASFLGIGIGFLLAGRVRDLFPFAPLGLAAMVTFILAFPVSVGSLAGKGRLDGAFGLPALPNWISLPIVFFLSAFTLAAIAQEVARTFSRFAPLEAYRVDIMGSLAGIVAFAVLSFLQLPPVAWGLVATVVFLVLLGGRYGRWQLIGAVLTVALLGVQSLPMFYDWSPYYKVRAGAPNTGKDGLSVSVNGIPHQTAYSVATLRQIAPFYFFPYEHLDTSALDDVLIIGAGTGNDVAVALSQGAKHVDAVEIDPVLQRLGREHHPDKPYSDPRVSVHINDGRAYLERTGKHYDLVVLALTDSLTIISGQSSLRLENYLFTEDAMRSVRERLKPGGQFSMYNYYESWLLERYGGTLGKVYDSPICVQTAQELGSRVQAVLTVNQAGDVANCKQTFEARLQLAPATDDHPFPYLLSRSIPPFYLVTLVLILAVALASVRLATGPLRQMRPFADLFFMGVAFLLLETKNVVQFALLFGTTWFVNAAVFAGVLLSVLAAVEVARRVRLPKPWVLYGLLLLTLAVSWIVPGSALLDLSPVLRFLAGTALAFAPIFLANLVFAQRFKDTSSSTTAFAANLLGAVLGGILEYTALLAGYRSLLIVAAVLYGLAFVFGRRHLSGSGAAA